jgi:hypothetical protein
MKKKKVNWYYDTNCKRCDGLNSWLLTPNETFNEKDIDFHKAYSNDHPFEIKWCDHCKCDTRQERVGWRSIKTA